MSTITLEECELLGDSKYRAYISQVEKALKAFEYTSEWADLISALAKLNKVLLNHGKFPVVPKRVTIGKRLAQCLHPALPSGVHLKALETYDIIFKCIGFKRLAQDLFTYSAGVFPLLPYAAMNVKPNLLALYENHFVPLGDCIKPGLTGLLLGLLPGLEEGSEYYDRTNALLEDFCKAVDATYFYGCLWECVLSCPSVRLPAITFCLAHFNRRQSMEDQLHIMGTNIDLMIEAQCAAVQDSSVLVQRSQLDLLLLGFPMHNSQLLKPDMSKLITAAINVVLRRDMSLNRRLYAWLLGTDANGAPMNIPEQKLRKVQRCDSVSSSESELVYFHIYSKDLLVYALIETLRESSEETPSMDGKPSNLRPFRILISLLDKPEIGSTILEDVLVEVFRCLYRECGPALKDESSSEKKDIFQQTADPIPKPTKKTKDPKAKDHKSNELVKTSNLLFGTFEPYFMWDFIGRKFHEVCRGAEKRKKNLDIHILSVCELCSLVEFLLEKVSLETYMETQTEHLPEMLRQVIVAITTHSDVLTETEITFSLRLCSSLLGKVLPSMTLLGGDDFSMAGSPRRMFSSRVQEHERESSPEASDRSASNREKDTDTDIYISADSDLDSEITRKSETPTLDPGLDVREGSFTDFMQYEDEFEELAGRIKISPRKSPLKATKPEQAPLTLMQACVHCFQMFFTTFVGRKVIKDKHIPKMCMELLSKKSKSSKSVPLILTPPVTPDSQMHSGIDDTHEYHVSVDVSEEWCEPFSYACKLLVDFSSFPMYCTDSQRVLFQSFKADGEFTYPEWLQLLITCSCNVDDFEIQSCAISTMLDLMSLTQSVLGVTDIKEEDESGRRKSASEGTISVVIVPILSPKHLTHLNDNTLFYKVVATNLWNYLGDDSPHYHQRAVDLLYQLHQLSPSSLICEDVIGSNLVSHEMKPRIEAHKKFAILWHLTRNQRSKGSPGMPVRTFERSMFVMLDSLQSDTSPTRALTQTWITHAVQRGDVARVLEPVILLLIHPDTARISIQHVNIHEPKKVKLSDSSDDVSSEAKVFAISSEGGNVIYHVSSQGGKISNKKNVEELRTLALTSMGDAGATTLTAPPPSRAETEMSYEKVNPSGLSLRVNPFGGSVSSLDKIIFDGFEPPSTNFPNIQNLKRLDTDTCKKEGIFFDDEEGDQGEGSSTDQGDSGSESAEKIVESILEEILISVTRTLPAKHDLVTLNTETTGTPTEYKPPPSAARRTRNPSVTSRDSNLGDEDLLNAVEAHAMMDNDTGSETDSIRNSMKEDIPGVHPLHTHLLLYTQKYDAKRTLYALSSLKAILETSPRLVVCGLASSSISSTQTPHLVELQTLLARHRRSVFGKNFFSELPGDAVISFRSSMYVEVLISICLYYIRSYYPNLMMSKLSEEELNGNKEVQILSSEILTLFLTELINVAQDSGKGFATYINDLLSRCKVQKAILHCVLASVYNARKKETQNENSNNITEAIISFNEENMDTNTNETFQIKLLKLLLVIIVLEEKVKKTDTDQSAVARPINFTPTLIGVRYMNSQTIVYQGMFLSAILSALKQQHLCHMHRHWIAMVTSALPHMGRALQHLVVSIVTQLCRNVELVALRYSKRRSNAEHRNIPSNVPPDHVLTILEGLTTLCHYCLLDGSQQVAIGSPLPSHSNNIVNDSATAGQIISNLIHVFNPYTHGREPSPAKEVTGAIAPVIDARRGLLSMLPRIIASMTALWKAIYNSELDAGDDSKQQPCWTIGRPKNVRHFILEFLSPISLHHGVNLMGAVAVVWNDRRKKGSTGNKRVISTACEDQLLLVNLVSAIKVLPTDTLVQTVKQVIKQPPPTNQDKNKKRTPLEVSMLQFFYAYVQRTEAKQLVDSWSSLLSLLKEGMQLNLSPPGQFLLLGILNEFVQKVPMLEERKDQKDLQDMAQKLLEGCSVIAGSSLEQTTWLRRNLAVKPGPQPDINGHEEALEDPDELGPLPSSPPPTMSKDAEASVCQYSVQALMMLAELIAPLLDVVYSSDEKDKVVPFLTSIMHNVFPYIRNHSTHNLPSFRACSQILSSLSGYQYTRKAWKKEAFELLLDTSFFQMDALCIGFWRTVIDNLMTHDKTTFRDLMARVAMTQSGSLNLFSSREQEFEQRAQLLKRLSFTIFCSETDQYQKFMPDIQERLSESLRLPQVPNVQAQVFLCFRVLILRMSPQHLTSLWPTIITELVHVFLQIEQELSPEVDECKTQLARLANLDSSWAFSNGLNAHNNPAWLHLYLSACKLLDMVLVLPADSAPQFQLYRWAFIGEPISEEQQRKRPDRPNFTPHIIRLARHMKHKYCQDGPDAKILPSTAGRPLLTTPTIRLLEDLLPFFNTLSQPDQSAHSAASASLSPSKSLMSKSQSAPEFTEVNSNHQALLDVRCKTSKQYVEQIIERDFMETMPRT